MMLEIEDLHTRYGATPVHHGVNISIGAGEVVGVLGPNGAGKTTLLRAIFGQLTIERGEIHLGDIRLDRLRTHEIAAAGVSISPEGRKVFGPMSVEDNLGVGAYTASNRDRPTATRLDEVYEIFPVLHERRRDYARNLSGGQQQMLAIGRALMAQPTLLLLDEPSLGLAPKLVARVAEAIRTARERLGMSVLVVEQDSSLAFGISDRVYLMNRGSIVASGLPAELRRSDLVRQLYLGTVA